MSQWEDPNEPNLAQRMQRAVGTDLLRDLIADSHRSSPVAARPPERRDYVAPPEPPTYQQWCYQRIGVRWSYERARDYYLTKQAAGEDVGPVTDRAHPLPLDGGK